MVSKFRTYVDDNFLGGVLEITVDEDKKITYGTLTFKDACSECSRRDECHEDHYDDCTINDDMTICASTKCHKSDEFNIVKGMDIVKLKIAKRYYSDLKQVSRFHIDHLTTLLKLYQQDYDFASRKINNIQHALADSGFTFYGVQPKPKVKTSNNKSTTKKTTKK